MSPQETERDGPTGAGCVAVALALILPITVVAALLAWMLLDLGVLMLVVFWVVVTLSLVGGLGSVIHALLVARSLSTSLRPELPEDEAY